MRINFTSSYSLIKKPKVQLGLILFLGFLIRFYRFDYPLLDWHSFRQADTASVTYRYTQEGIDFLRPRYHDLSNIQSGLDNPTGYRMVEFPFINATIALVLKMIPQAELVMTSRFFSILASMGTMLSLYWLIIQISSRDKEAHKVALVSTSFFAFLPFSIYYSRVVLPEPFFLLFSSFSIALFISWARTRNTWHWWLSAFTLALAFLLKPFAVFLAPVYLVSLVIFKKQFFKDLRTYLFPVISILPFLLWRRWILNFPEGIPASYWLFNQDGIRFRPAWFRWLFWERISLVMGGLLTPIFLPANLIKKDRSFWFLSAWWIGLILYMSVIATGNVRHDYYQVLLLPCLSFSLGRGFVHAFDLTKKYLKDKRLPQPRLISLILFCSTIAIGLFISWNRVGGYFNVNNWEYYRAGEEVRLLTPADALIIAPAQGDTMFLFQTRRNGWPIGYYIDDKIEQGATHYVSTSFDDETRFLEEKYLTLRKTSEFVIIDLKNRRDSEQD